MNLKDRIIELIEQGNSCYLDCNETEQAELMGLHMATDVDVAWDALCEAWPDVGLSLARLAACDVDYDGLDFAMELRSKLARHGERMEDFWEEQWDRAAEEIRLSREQAA